MAVVRPDAGHDLGLRSIAADSARPRLRPSNGNLIKFLPKRNAKETPVPKRLSVSGKVTDETGQPIPGVNALY